MQIRQVFFEIFDRVFELQCEQPTQACTVLGSCQLRLVKNLHRDRISQINQRRKTNQGLVTFANFHQLGQLAKAPAGVALGYPCSCECYAFNSW